MTAQVELRAAGRTGGIWRHGDFLRLFAGTTISALGSEVTALAISLLAAVSLNASPIQMGVLTAMGTLPALLFGLFAGVWVDRVRRRAILIAADVGRAVLLASIPLVAVVGLLSMEYLYTVTFLTGTLSVFFDVAYVSYLPAVVHSDDLLEGNCKLETSASATQMVGPSAAGILVQALTAPIAILLDAISFLISALFIRSIRAGEPAIEHHDERQSFWQEAVEGLKVVWRDPVLRAMGLNDGTRSFFFNLMLAVYMLHLTRDLHVPPALIGLIGIGAGPGTLLGAVLASRLPRRWGLGPTMTVFALIPGFGVTLMSLADGSLTVVVVLFMVGWALAGLSSAYDINAVTLRQRVVPQHLQGRVNSLMHFIFWGSMPLGALAGGFLGDTIGLRATIAVGAAGALLSALWIWCSPVRWMHE